ncbi:hypothetical protein Tco_0686158, partial [Tanacetum coccineum]
YWTDANLHMHLEEIKVDKTLRFAEEPVEIKSLKRSRILIVKSIGTRSKVDKTLCFVEEPVEIIDLEVKSLKRSRIPIVQSIGTRSEIIRIS